MNNIFDTHAHYTDEAFDNDRAALLDSLPQCGVKYIMLAASSLETSERGIEISRRYGYIYASVGVHPESVDDTPSDYIETLRRLSEFEKVKAIGEIGLDYHYEGYNRERQIKLFDEQLALAAELDLPVIIHSREATEDTMELLRRYKPRGVMHCFSGSLETAKDVLSLGMSISFTGVLTFKNAKKALNVLSEIPLDRFMLETDCPYMAPVPYRGERCDSSMIPEIAKKAAEIKGLSPQEILDITCKNGERLFSIG